MPKSDSGNRSSVRSATLALCLALLGAASMLYYHLHLFIPNVLQVRAAKGLGNGYAFGDDFYPVWLAAHLSRLDHRNPYSPETTRQIQIGLFGRPLNPLNPTDPPVDYRELAYPAFTELLVWPVAGMQFSQLRAHSCAAVDADHRRQPLAMDARTAMARPSPVVRGDRCARALQLSGSRSPVRRTTRLDRRMLAGRCCISSQAKPSFACRSFDGIDPDQTADDLACDRVSVAVESLRSSPCEVLGRLSDHACVPGRFFSDSLAALDRAMDQNPARISPLCNAPIGYRPARQLESLSRQSANHRSVGSLLSTGVAKSSRDSRFARLLVDLEFGTRRHIGYPAARAGYL